jgi:tetratricopeptide (TPR) repeat protein
MSAWFSLTDGDYPGVIAAANRGIAAAGERDVSVQLLAQKAKAYARVGDRHLLEVSLEKGRELLERQPYPDDITNHFVIDPAKWDFYAMDCYRISGQDDLARTYAEEVLRIGTDVSGRERSPMRNAEARITLGVVAAREGDLQSAIELGEQALKADRQSLPSLLMVSSDLEHEVIKRFPREHDTAEYVNHLHTLSTAS